METGSEPHRARSRHAQHLSPCCAPSTPPALRSVLSAHLPPFDYSHLTHIFLSFLESLGGEYRHCLSAYFRHTRPICQSQSEAAWQVVGGVG